MDDFSGRTAFITGGAQGIGLGIARALAKEGVKVVLADIDSAALAVAKAELEAVTEVATFVFDVRDREEYERVAVAAETALGPVTLLFNNAGVIGATAPALMTYAMWDWVIGINLHGVINGVQTFVPRMIASGESAYIVNTASGAGLVDGGSGFLYTTSKFAVVGMSESLFRELARHSIGVSVLCPGPVATGIIDHTEGQRPSGERLPSKVNAILDASRQYLAAGTSPDRVGDMVLDAIRAGRLYIHTDNVVEELVKLRAQMILDALPSALG
jgi:NAD(P)-dependent dehydrogenase (short-subunit alcohol dehydrogenase family)